MKNEPIKRYSLSEQVANQLEKMIENNVYKINERIPTEVELIECFNVSRNTIREAIRELVSAGILEVRQGDGTYVRANNRFDATISKQLREAEHPGGDRNQKDYYRSPEKGPRRELYQGNFTRISVGG